MTGYANCMQVDGAWESRAAYTNPDQPVFRSIGEAVGDDVSEDSIKCLAADLVSIRTGSTDCYPFWIEGATIEVGVDTAGKPIKQDRFVWLT